MSWQQPVNATAFRRLDVDALDCSDCYTEAAIAETPSLGPDHRQVVAALHGGQLDVALQLALRNPPFHTRNADAKQRACQLVGQVSVDASPLGHTSAN